MDDDTRQQVLARLSRAEGQLSGVRRLIDEGSECVDVLIQIAAVRGALAKIGQVMLGNHLETCVRDAFDAGDEELRRRQIDELMDIFGRYGGLATR